MIVEKMLNITKPAALAHCKDSWFCYVKPTYSKG